MANKYLVGQVSAAMLANGKPTLDSDRRILNQPAIVSDSESAAGNLQAAFAEYSAELLRRARTGQVIAKDWQLATSVATASVKIAAEQREQASQIKLALHSDDDIVQLLVQSVLALGERGVYILECALATTQAHKTTEPKP
jgi:hypothetical protein